MPESRRTFLAAVAAATGSLAATQVLFAQQSVTPPPRPAPGDIHLPDAGRPKAPRVDPALLEKNEREFLAGIEELYRLTSALRDEVHKTTTSDVLSMGVYKKTQEIEKLAKQLKNKAAHAIS